MRNNNYGLKLKRKIKNLFSIKTIEYGHFLHFQSENKIYLKMKMLQTL